MSVAENNNHQGSWGSILLIYGIGVFGATTISQAITVARDMAVLRASDARIASSAC